MKNVKINDIPNNLIVYFIILLALPWSLILFYFVRADKTKLAPFALLMFSIYGFFFNLIIIYFYSRG